MKLNGFEVELKEANGKWKLEIKESLPVMEFTKILAIVREHGGTYTRNDGFTFNEKPNFGKVKKSKSEVKVAAPTTKEPEKKVSVPSDIEKKYEESKKKALTKKEAEAVKGVEFEVYPVASFEECEEYLNAVKIAMKNRDAEHQDMLDMLIEVCRTDEELRQYITHKDYLTVFAKGGAAFCKREKRIENNCAEASATEILDDVIAEFKKPVKKVVKKKKGKEDK